MSDVKNKNGRGSSEYRATLDAIRVIAFREPGDRLVDEKDMADAIARALDIEEGCDCPAFEALADLQDEIEEDLEAALGWVDAVGELVGIAQGRLSPDAVYAALEARLGAQVPDARAGAANDEVRLIDPTDTLAHFMEAMEAMGLAPAVATLYADSLPRMTPLLRARFVRVFSGSGIGVEALREQAETITVHPGAALMMRTVLAKMLIGHSLLTSGLPEPVSGTVMRSLDALNMDDMEDMFSRILSGRGSEVLLRLTGRPGHLRAEFNVSDLARDLHAPLQRMVQESADCGALDPTDVGQGHVRH